jgi:hypothetical protein
MWKSCSWLDAAKAHYNKRRVQHRVSAPGISKVWTSPWYDTDAFGSSPRNEYRVWVLDKKKRQQAVVSSV